MGVIGVPEGSLRRRIPLFFGNEEQDTAEYEAQRFEKEYPVQAQLHEHTNSVVNSTLVRNDVVLVYKVVTNWHVGTGGTSNSLEIEIDTGSIGGLDKFKVSLSQLSDGSAYEDEWNFDPPIRMAYSEWPGSGFEPRFRTDHADNSVGGTVTHKTRFFYRKFKELL